jgi:hypothetical protein
MARMGFSGAIILEMAGQEDDQAVLDGARRAPRHLRDMSRRLDLSS